MRDFLQLRLHQRLHFAQGLSHGDRDQFRVGRLGEQQKVFDNPFQSVNFAADEGGILKFGRAPGPDAFVACKARL